MLATDRFVDAQVRRASRNSLIANCAVLVLLGLAAWFGSTYYYFFFHGPETLTDADLLNLADESGRSGLLSYAEIQNRVLVNSGWKEQSLTDEHKYAEATWFLMPVGEHEMLVLANNVEDGRHLLGPISTLREMDRSVVEELELAHPQLRGRILPIMLNNVAAFNVAGYLGLAITLPTILYCCWNIGRALQNDRNPLRHGSVRRLRKHGDPEQLAGEINSDVAAGPVMRYGRATLSSLWLLRPTLFGFAAAPLSELVWVYQLEQQYESFLVMCFRDGRSQSISLKDKQVAALVKEIAERVPWAICGYDADSLKRWRHDRASIISQADESRRQIRAHQR